MKMNVTSCGDCPLCNSDNEYGNSCNAPDNDIEEGECEFDKLPDKCPLHTIGTLIITIK